MNIGIDGNEANVRQQVGVSVYTHQLLHYFQQMATDKLVFTIYLRDKPLEHMPDTTPHFRYKVVGPKQLWSQIALPVHLFTNSKPDVFFSPAHYAPRISPVPTVVTIHDLSYFYYPHEFLKKDLYQLKNWTKYSVDRARKVITVSKHTKYDLIKFYSVPENKIAVIHNGFEKNLPAGKSSKLGTNDPYILYVGTLQPRKNINTLIRAFAQYVTQFPKYKLIITGKKGWLYEEIFQEVQRLGLEDKVIFKGHVTDVELANLYTHAFCFVMPSLYEGFGIPILEAMSYESPVISSNTAALPEVGGEACLYFDPVHIDQLVEQLMLLTEDKKLRRELIQKGKEQIRKFSWQKCAKETLDILTSIKP